MPRSSPSGPGPFRSLFSDDDEPDRPARRGGCFRAILLLVGAVAVLALLSSVGIGIYYGIQALSYDMDQVKEVPERTIVYDRSGKEMGHVSGHGENRLVVPASEVSPHFVNALLAREDSRFFDHGGIDYMGLGRAVIANLKSGEMDQGASTLTMQLARNSFELREKSIQRKLLEVAIAQRIERNYTKQEILGFYMNRIYFGAGLYGIERASQGFFMKPASDLTAGEGAMLAGIIRGPSLLNPFRSIDDAKATRDEVLARMIAEGTITEAEAQSARNEEIVLRPPDQRLATGTYILQTVFDLLETFLQDPEDVKLGGLRIHTTIDSGIQTAAEKALDSHLASIESRSGYRHPKRSAHQKGQATRYLQGAVVTLDNSNGAVRALVGGRDFGESSFNRAYQSRRQVGSTFKPFVYAVAMDRGGLQPGVYVSDDGIRIDTGEGPAWSPRNSDGAFTGLQPAAVGLIKSRNTMTVRVGQIAGLGNVRSLASALKMGEIPNSPVVYLGAFEASPYTLTSAYQTLSSGGTHLTTYLIDRIERRDGAVLFQHDPTGTKIFPESVSWVTTDMLGKVIEEGTGRGARSVGYTAPCYGKTGTTNDYRDAWFVGYTDKLTTGVWVGLDQPATIMDRGYGSTLALPIWTETMKAAEENGFAASPIPAPAGTTETILCRECGLIGSNRTRHPYSMPLPPDMRPQGTCRGHGIGLFSNRNGEPQAFPVPGFPGMPDAEGFPPPRNPAAENSGPAGAFRRLGRFLFGGGSR